MKKKTLIYSLFIPLLSFVASCDKNSGALRLMHEPQDEYYNQYTVSGRTQKSNFRYLGDIESVWDNYNGEGVKVCIIDTGININNPEFENAISNDSAYIHTVFTNPDNDDEYQIVVDAGKDKLMHDFEGGQFNAHGTNVAGVIGARENHNDIVGIAPKVELLIIKCDLEDYSVNAALKYAADKGVDIINMSFGAYAEPYTDINGVIHNTLIDDYYPECETSMVEGINYAYEHDVILIASGGNEKTDALCYPAANDHVIGVGSLAQDKGDELASFSNFNKPNSKSIDNNSIDIVAPGYVITTGFDGADKVESKNGTSFSAPIVSAAAALWKQKNPDGTPDQFKEDLIASATDIGEIGYDPTFANGRLNVKALLDIEHEEEIKNYDFVLSTTNIVGYVGDNKTISLTDNNNLEGLSISWTSRNNQVASISGTSRNPIIKLLKEGNTIIDVTVTYKSHIIYQNEINVTVNQKQSEPEQKKSGCMGSIIASSMIISLSFISGSILLFIKKKSK